MTQKEREREGVYEEVERDDAAEGERPRKGQADVDIHMTHIETCMKDMHQHMQYACFSR